MKFATMLVLASGLLSAAAPVVSVNAREASEDLLERDPKLTGTQAAFAAAGIASSITLLGNALLKKFGAEKTARDLSAQEDTDPLLLIAFDPASLDLGNLGLDNLGLEKRDPKFPFSENTAKVIAGSLGALATVIGNGIINGQINLPGGSNEE